MSLNLSASVANIGVKMTPVLAELADDGLLKSPEGRRDVLEVFLLLTSNAFLADKYKSRYLGASDVVAAKMNTALAEHLLASAEVWLERN